MVKDNIGKSATIKKYLSYSVGLLQDSMPYNFVSYYLLFFLTDFAGISPAVGGTILFIAVLWDGIIDPAIGYFSDNSRNPMGRRRPFILGSILPIFITLSLMFAPLDVPDLFKPAYYLGLTLAFWTAFSMFSIPFNSFGAEVVTDTNQRNTLRMVCGLFTYVGVWFATAGPMFVQAFVESKGLPDEMTWFASAVVFGAIGAVGALLCWRFTRGTEKPLDQSKIKIIPKREIPKDLLRSFRVLLKTRVVRIVCLIAFVYNIFFAVKATGFVYLMTNNLDLPAASQGLFWTIAAVINYITLPILNIIASKISKRATFIIMWSTMIIYAGIFFVLQIGSFEQLVAYQVIFAFSNVCFWVIGYSLVYDTVEVVEFQHGDNKSGGILGIFTLTQTAGYAVGGWIAGIVLSIVGYDASLETQSQHVLWGINTMMTAVPAVILTIGLVLMIRFPLNRVKHQKLSVELEKKRAGQEYSTDGFSDIF